MFPGPPEPDITWEELIAPLAVSAEVTRGYRLEAPTRGHERDVVWIVRDDAGRVVEVHAVDGDQWPEALRTPSFGVDYEAPRTTAPEADAVAVTEALAEAIRRNDPGGASAGEVPLGDAPEPGSWRGWLGRLGPRAPTPVWTPLALLITAERPGREPALLFLVGLLLRLALGPWAPFNVNGQGSKWLAGALNPAEIASYGPGYRELFGWAAYIEPSGAPIFAANAVLSALIPPLVWAIARAAGLTPVRALLAAGLLVIDPVTLRYAASETYLTPLLLLTTAVSWLTLRPGRASLLAIVLLGAQVARLHPSGWAPLVIAPLVGWPRGPRAVAAATAAAGAGALLGSGAVLADVLAAIEQGTLIRPVLHPGALGWALLPAGLALLRARPLTLAVLAAAVADLLLRSTYDQSAVWQAAFDRLYCVPLLLLLAELTPAPLLERRQVRLAAAALGTAVIAALGAPVVLARTTDDAEHRWAVDTLRTLPAGCRVLYVARPDPIVTVLLPPVRGVELAPIDAQGPVNLKPLLRGDCLRYVRTSACATQSGRAGCERVESMLQLTPVAQAELPAAPSHRDVRYRADPIEVALFELTSPR